MSGKRISQLCACLLILVLCRPLAASAYERTATPWYYDTTRYDTEVLMQGFTWNASVNGQKHVWYRHIADKGRNLAEAGITHLWYPPVSRSVAPQGYMPGDYYDLGHGEDLGHNRTLYGNATELKHSITVLKKLGITPIADIVINHRCASHQDGGVWNVFHPPSGKMWWEKWAIVGGDYAGTGQADTGGDFGAAPDIDHTNARVRADIVAWLRWLRDEVGFAGWRFDFSKGYGARFVKEYVQATTPKFAVGEYWTSMNYENKSNLSPNQDSHRKQLCDWIDGAEGAATAFDFTTKGILQVACKGGDYWRLRGADGRASGLIGWWPARSVTFIDNHDTGSTQAHWPFPSEKVLEGYAYILTHPGVPTVFWDHFYSWGQEHHDRIRDLVLLRHELGIHRNSSLKIISAEHGLYAATVDGKLALRLGSKHWEPGEGWSQRLAGPGYVVWERTSTKR